MQKNKNRGKMRKTTLKYLTRKIGYHRKGFLTCSPVLENKCTLETPFKT